MSWSTRAPTVAASTLRLVWVSSALAVALLASCLRTFDPPPDSLAAPWSYLAVVLVAAVVATVVAVAGQGYGSKEWAARELRAGR